MNQKKQLSILEFSRLTGISRDNLRFYDRIGLLCPEQRGENNYRYYARSQLNSAYLISSLRLLEVGLEDIRRYSAGRTPERMLAFFAQQEERIQAEIEKMKEECGTTVLSIAHRLSPCKTATRSSSWTRAASCSGAPTASWRARRGCFGTWRWGFANKLMKRVGFSPDAPLFYRFCWEIILMRPPARIMPR